MPVLDNWYRPLALNPLFLIVILRMHPAVVTSAIAWLFVRFVKGTGGGGKRTPTGGFVMRCMLQKRAYLDNTFLKHK